MSSRMAGSVLLRYVSARHLFTVAVTSLAAAARPLLTGGDNVLPADVKIENVPAPAIAIYYWRLPADAKLKDVIIVVRTDEAHHRDVNHYASDIHYQGMKLKVTPAPLGYH